MVCKISRAAIHCPLQCPAAPGTPLNASFYLTDFPKPINIPFTIMLDFPVKEAGTVTKIPDD